MQVIDSFEQLLHYTLHVLWLQDDFVPVLLDQVTKVDNSVLQDEVEQAVQVEDVMELNDVWVVHFLQDFDLSEKWKLQTIKTHLSLLLDYNEL